MSASARWRRNNAARVGDLLLPSREKVRPQAGDEGFFMRERKAPRNATSGFAPRPPLMGR